MTITETEQTYELIPLDELAHHPDNLRVDYVNDIDELVASIHAVGIIEPLVVGPKYHGKHAVFAGNRRLAAAAVAGLDAVPCVIRPVAGDAEVAEIMLVENLQRAGLNPIEEGTGFARLAELGLTQREIAERVGCNQSHVSKRISLAALPEVARSWVVAGSLKVDDALELAKLNDDQAQAVDAIARSLSGDVGPIPEWLVTREINTVLADRKRATNIATGEASGLWRLDSDPMAYRSKHEKCKKADATHWFVAERGNPSIVWAREKAKPPANGEAIDAATEELRSLVKSTYELDRERIERRTETLSEAVRRAGQTDEFRAHFIEAAADIGIRTALDSGSEVVLSGRRDDLPDDLDQDDVVLMLAYLVLAEVCNNIELGSGAIDVDRWALQYLVEFGYDLDDEEEAVLPRISQADEPPTPETIAEADPHSMVVDLMDQLEQSVSAAKEARRDRDPEPAVAVGPAGPVVVDPEPSTVDELIERDVTGAGWVISDEFHDATTMEEAEAAAFAEDTGAHLRTKPAGMGDDEWDLQRTTPPWKAYAFVPDAKLVAGIREHNGAAKLRWAAVYEAANKTRPAVLAAIAERLVELGGDDAT